MPAANAGTQFGNCCEGLKDALTSEEFSLTNPLPLVVLRYTLYPLTVEALALQVNITECGLVVAAKCAITAASIGSVLAR